jgi:CRISPR-associated protein Cmr2
MTLNKYDFYQSSYKDEQREDKAIQYHSYCKQNAKDIANKEKKRTLISNCSKKWFQDKKLEFLTETANNSSGISSNPDDLLKQLLPFSFGVRTDFCLASPYYSADDDKYSIFDNPLLKENVFKVPMMRGSSWKGVIASAARTALEQDFSVENILSFGRLFGSGSEEFREIEALVKKHDYNQKYQKKILFYALMKFGKVSMKNINEEKQKEELWKKIKAKELQTQRGRLVFYPSYFNKIGLEMINPHKRRTKAGTHPIYYEVVPAGAEAIFQLLYIPADNITKPDAVRKVEYEKDKELLIAALKLIFQANDEKPQIKIGAKTKLGWGRIVPRDEEKFQKMIVEVKDERTNQ